MSAAAGVLGQYSAAAGAVEFLFTIESVQRNNENLQVTMGRIVRIVRRNASLWGKSQFYKAEFSRSFSRPIGRKAPFFESYSPEPLYFVKYSATFHMREFRPRKSPVVQL
ncbi:hypothetical protein [Arthrobacter sp. ISL-5]|uniref:hypothetical protein n=1 Tax=Arthrobacter sp. ISL-5 TaxID=2819111 RepID=UPI001BE9AE78|nr:hypothetical protein [Arthrobacter sp. ISL-5]MBT2551518.1 hypothetical protein [Arthrobacter sp. ISL-5]